MEETIDWLQGRPYYVDQIAAHHVDPGRSGTTTDLSLDERVADALAEHGITSIYNHQAAAIRAIRDGRDAVLATPTASGKSLAYTVPAFERALTDGATTLYLAPQVALINDQAETLGAIERAIGFGTQLGVDRYTGRLSRTDKRAVRDRRPTLVLTTPDMLHYGLLPHARRLWDWFFERLDLVVLDELHEYRGVFGSHVGLVLRRLARTCAEFDRAPDVVCCSATIGNPIEHAATVTGRSPDGITLVDTDTSASGPTHWVLWNPPVYQDPDRGHDTGRRRSSHVESTRLFADLIMRGYQTAVFTGARQVAERYATESADELRERGESTAANRVAAYHAALSRDRRESIEAGLQDGSLCGVWTTSALELGVDIGGLDAVILDGYPGTRMTTWQRAGRAGRGTDPSLVVLVAGEDQLDQYVMTHPEALFEGDPEQAVANPANDQLLPQHALAAAAESWIRPEDRDHFPGGFPDVIADLADTGALDTRATNGGLRWAYDDGGSPQHEMSIRAIGDREVQLIDRASGSSIGTLGFRDALRDAHPGAIYHHQGETYEVVDLDLRSDVAELSSTHAQYYTQILSEKQITVDEDRDTGSLSGAPTASVRFAALTVSEQITGFERRDQRSGEPRGREPLDLPETTTQTMGLYFTVPNPLAADLQASEGSFPGAIHAVEHAMIGLFPLQLVCDRRDVGGLSTPVHPHTDRSTIFIYDGYEGGVGLTRTGFEQINTLMRDTADLLAECPCTSGCPACVQSPYCGNANEPLDKELAAQLAAHLVD